MLCAAAVRSLGTGSLSQKLCSTTSVLANQHRCMSEHWISGSKCKIVPINHMSKKHWKPDFKKERGEKVQEIDLPDFHEKNDHLTPQELRMKMKLRGISPFRSWNERPVYMACTPNIFEPYIPPENDGKLSMASKDGAKQKMEMGTKKGKMYMATRKIYQYDEDFDMKEFAGVAQEIYINAHKALAEEDNEKLLDLVTEHAFKFMTHETARKTIRWQFIESVEKPRAVYARCTDILTKDNIFAQVTVRMHTKQTLAVYDRFGRLMHGSEVVAKDVLDYVVFEKNISSTNGVWRLHDRIIPNWAPRRAPALRTFRHQPLEETPAEEAAPEDPAPKDAAPDEGVAVAVAN